MATLNLVQARFEVDEARTVAPTTKTTRPTVVEEYGLTAAAMGGAALGAIGGAVLGASLDGLLPVVGTLGTMFGSGAAAGLWCLFAPLWSRG